MAAALDQRRRFDLLLTEAKGYRSRELVTIAAQPAPWPAGVPINGFGQIASSAAEIVALTLVPVDARAGPVERVLVVARDAEINDFYVQYYDHIIVDPPAWNARLAQLGIIVRRGIFEPVRWLPVGARLVFPDDGGGGDGSSSSRTELVPVPGAPGSPPPHVIEVRLGLLAVAIAWRRRGRLPRP
jgi:hypothetical protein